MDIFNDPAFDNMPVEVKEGILKLAERLRGKDIREAVPYIATFMAALPKGYTPGKEEKLAMINAAATGLNKEERDRLFRVLKPFI